MGLGLSRPLLSCRGLSFDSLGFYQSLNLGVGVAGLAWLIGPTDLGGTLSWRGPERCERRMNLQFSFPCDRLVFIGHTFSLRLIAIQAYCV